VLPSIEFRRDCLTQYAAPGEHYMGSAARTAMSELPCEPGCPLTSPFA
jgi:hypothetical protein